MTWKPIERCCRELGSYFKFVCVQNLEGFMAAALRIAMAKTAIYDEIIDADYVMICGGSGILSPVSPALRSD